MNKIKFTILGSGIYLPSKLVTSDELETMLFYPSGTIKKASGVNTRYYVLEETTSQLAAAAAKQAFENTKIEKDEIDAIVFVGGVTQQAIPSTAALIHQKLELKDVVAFDINASCLGFINGLLCIGNMISSGIYRNVLVVSADIASAGLNPDDPKTASLFGDGAAAFILGPSKEKGILSYHFETKSEYADICQCKAGGTLNRLNAKIDKEDLYFQMNGPQLVKAVMRPLLEMFKELTEKAGKNIQLYIPHQASPFALDLIQRKLKLAKESFVNIAREYGNMIATSIPFAFHMAIENKKIKRGDRVMLFGTAAGLSIGGVVLEY